MIDKSKASIWMLAQVTGSAIARAFSTIMQKSFNILSLLATAVCAINLEWTASDGNRYSAEESTRLSPGCLNLTTDAEGISYFSVGGPIGWPDFNQTVNAADVDLPAGAYVALSLANSLVVARAYQLQEDPAIAFMHGAVPSTSDDTAFTQYLPGRIPVPPALGEGPLAGLRFAVKDIFHVKGLKTSGGSRAYYETFGPQNYTNAVIETSLAAGAQLVGKTKTIAFALGTPRNGWEVDYQDPWSFRGDGYQTTGGSSSGSSAAIVAYDWLDFTIGSDTGGSVRFPARFAGFYGYKPTHGIYNITGILPAISEQDTPGHMARSPSIFTRVGRIWLNSTTFAMEQPALPTTIQYWADEAPLTQPAAEAMKQAFFANVTQALNLSSTSVNLTRSFNLQRILLDHLSRPKLRAVVGPNRRTPGSSLRSEARRRCLPARRPISEPNMGRRRQFHHAITLHRSSPQARRVRCMVQHLHPTQHHYEQHIQPIELRHNRRPQPAPPARHRKIRPNAFRPRAWCLQRHGSVFRGLS
jgi:hypothetical protein